MFTYIIICVFLILLIIAVLSLVILSRMIRKKHKAEIAANNPMRRISFKPPLFALENNLLSNEMFYFDATNFYAINHKQQRKAVFPITDIVELRRTSVTVRDKKVWQVIFHGTDNNEIVFKFINNYSIINKEFPEFYKKIAQVNPAAIKSKWSLWAM